MTTTAFILQSAQNFAQEILTPPRKQEESASSDSRVIHHHYHSGYWGWYAYPISDRSNDLSSPNQKMDKDELIVIGAIVTIFSCLYLIGSERAIQSGISDHRQELDDQAYYLGESREPEQLKTLNVIKIEKKMLDAMHSQSSTGLMIKGALLVSAIAALAGVFVIAPALLTAAAVGGTISLTATLFHWGYRDADTSVQEEAVRLRHAIGLAQRAQ